ncbi:FAD-dependent oxidoreductase [Sneathiella limimaris]|uniref:FAD-dependent oxidoreductase n=1 Tax=Sneathiella limimaris TaxID=1964213 RepID=UPI00146A053C
MKKHKNYYFATKNRSLSFSALEGDAKADVCIIGAGFTGLGAALELIGKGYKVAILEAAEVGHGASGRNGGQVASGYSAGMMEAARIVGAADAALLWQFSEEAKEILHARLEQHKIDCDFRWGEYYAAPKKSHLDWLKAEREFVEKSYGYEKYRWVDEPGMREILAGDRYIGALLDLEGGHLHPLNYLLGLAEAVSTRGGMIFENSAAISFTEGKSLKIQTEKGEVSADVLILAGNAYLKNLAPKLFNRMVPIKSSILATEPLGSERAASLMKTTACVADTYFDLDYFKMAPDTRLIYGGRDFSFGRSTLQNNAVRDNMLKTFPMLQNVKIDYLWSGQLSITRQRLPDVGQLHKNVFYAHGYSGQGVPLSAIVSRVLAEAVDGQLSRFDVFNRIPHKKVPRSKALQVPLYHLVLLWNRIKDML